MATRANIADLVLLGGKVLTLDEKSSIEQAVAVRDGRILAVGNNDRVSRLIGPDTHVVDLKGHLLMPGINDSHAHVAEMAGTHPAQMLDLSYPAVRSIADIRAAVRRRAASLTPGEWIRGQGYEPNRLAECLEDPRRQPHRLDLDGVAPDNPVFLTEFSGHNAWVNSRALSLAGVDATTPDPQGGHLVREEGSEEPTGVLKEPAAMGLVSGVMPVYTPGQLREFVRQGMRQMAAEGVTSFTEAALGPGGDHYNGGLLGQGVIDAYRALHAEGQLTARVSILVLFEDSSHMNPKRLADGIAAFDWQSGTDPMWLRIPGIKLFADGIPITGTAWMSEDYLKPYERSAGALTVQGGSDVERCQNLVDMIALAHGRGLQIGVHATGDRAIRIVLDGFEEGLRRAPLRQPPRHTVHHACFITPADLRRVARLQAVVNMQPSIQSMVADSELANVGPERASYEWPYREVLRAGVCLALASDAPVTPPNWRYGVQAAVQRRALGSGEVFGADQALSREEALRGYTLAGAWQDGMEGHKGSIEVGKLADMIVLGQDILSVPTEQIHAVPVWLTILGGRAVFDGSAGQLELPPQWHDSLPARADASSRDDESAAARWVAGSDPHRLGYGSRHACPACR